MHLPQNAARFPSKNPRGQAFLISLCVVVVSNPSIAQLVERRTVDDMLAILRSLVQFRLEGDWF